MDAIPQFDEKPSNRKNRGGDGRKRENLLSSSTSPKKEMIHSPRNWPPGFWVGPDTHGPYLVGSNLVINAGLRLRPNLVASHADRLVSLQTSTQLFFKVRSPDAFTPSSPSIRAQLFWVQSALLIHRAHYIVNPSSSQPWAPWNYWSNKSNLMALLQIPSCRTFGSRANFFWVEVFLTKMMKLENNWFNTYTQTWFKNQPINFVALCRHPPVI